MELNEFIENCSSLPNRDFPPDKKQEEVISFGNGPLWVVAGPGSGKTDSIALRCLKLMIVDGVNPKSIIVTTFTEKAARNLEDRIGLYMQHFISIDPSLKNIDYTQLRTGTIHSISNEIMQEIRYSGYQNYRLLEDLENTLFILEHSSFTQQGKKFDESKFKPIWDDPDFSGYFKKFSLVTNRGWNPKSGFPPNRWNRVEFIKKAFDTIINENIELIMLSSSKRRSLQLISELYEEYRQKLESMYRVDFSHLQYKFLQFLNSSESKSLLNGDGTSIFPGIKHVLIDEYQDTNTIQEQIYFKLAEPTGNICVVGDDDQALYRFRGGRVELMIRFPEMCTKFWPQFVAHPIFLNTNYRSHKEIVAFCDDYIRSFIGESETITRVPGKPQLLAGSPIKGEYPAAALHVENGSGGTNSGVEELAEYFSQTVKELKENRIIADYSEIALLMPSTRSSVSAPKMFMNALDRWGIPYYNPRGIPVIETEEVETLLGAFLNIVDSIGGHFSGKLEGISNFVTKWRDRYAKVAKTYPEIASYVKIVSDNISRKDGGVDIGANMLELIYYLTGFEPFISWLNDPLKALHIGLVTQVFDSFSNVPSVNNPDVMLGTIHKSGTDKGVSYRWKNSFYFSLVAMLTQIGMSEDEDEAISYPPGRVPIMTIHQSKGLEFPFVYVHGLSSWKPKRGDITFEKVLKGEFEEGQSTLPNKEIDQMAKQDVVRMFYVAYSRAQYALTLLIQKYDRTTPGIGCGGGDWSIYHNLKRV